MCSWKLALLLDIKCMPEYKCATKQSLRFNEGRKTSAVLVLLMADF